MQDGGWRMQIHECFCFTNLSTSDGFDACWLDSGAPSPLSRQQRQEEERIRREQKEAQRREEVTFMQQTAESERLRRFDGQGDTRLLFLVADFFPFQK